jgi:predicted DNA binding protein
MGSQKQHIYILKGTDDNIEKFLNSVKNFYNKNIEIQKIEYKDPNVLSGLTSIQREIIDYANKYGYYDYP